MLKSYEGSREIECIPQMFSLGISNFKDGIRRHSSRDISQKELERPDALTIQA